MKTYDVLLRVQASALSTVLAALDGSGTLVEVKETPVAMPARKGYKNGRRNKGISGESLVIDALEKAKLPMTLKKITALFVAHGFAETSASPTISTLVRLGKVIRNENGSVQLKETK